MTSGPGGPLTKPSAISIRIERSRFNRWSALVLIIVSASILYVVGQRRMPVELHASGIVWPAGGITRLSPPLKGVVESVQVREGDLVAAHQPLTLVRHARVSKAYVERVRLREESLKARIEAIQQRIAEAESTRSVETLAALIPLENDLQASLQEVQAGIDQLREQSATLLYAPRRGRVVEVRALEGVEVGPEDALVTIVSENAQLIVLSYVAPETIGDIAPSAGGRVSFRTASGNSVSVASRVISISKLPVSPADVDRSILIPRAMHEVALELDLHELSQAGVEISAGQAVGSTFEIEQTSLIHWIFSRFTDA